MGHDCPNAKIVWGRGRELDLCVRGGFSVPKPMRCSLGGVPIVSSARSDIGCRECGLTLFRSEHGLRACIEDEVRRARERHARDGTVVVRP